MLLAQIVTVSYTAEASPVHLHPQRTPSRQAVIRNKGWLPSEVSLCRSISRQTVFIADSHNVEATDAPPDRQSHLIRESFERTVLRLHASRKVLHRYGLTSGGG